MSEKNVPDTRPVLYSTLYSRMVPVARACGYALALHGSLLTDLDVVAIPWTEDALEAGALRFALTNELGLVMVAGSMNKPHGRCAYTLMAPGWEWGCYLDLSIMPLKGPTDAAR